MKKFVLTLSAAIIALAGCTGQMEKDYTQMVDTRIGTGGHGHVFVGASVPFGAVQLGPTSIPQAWDWTSGYHVSDSTCIGFSHTHLNGTGIGDLFDITVMPVVGEVTYARGEEDKNAADYGMSSGLWSYADRTQEITRPDYYSVLLTRYGIKAELTATSRVGLHRYTFPASSESAIVIDLENGGCWDKSTECGLEKVDNNTIRGWRFSKGWANDQKIYFVAKFNKDFSDFTLHGNENMYGRAHFSTKDGEEIMMKVAISPVSMDNAAMNMEAELPGWDFEAVVEASHDAWNAELSKIDIETENTVSEKIFYTSLYHTMIAPSEFCDVDLSYRGADAKIHKGTSKSYTTLSLWDTYRAAMPLMSIVNPERYGEVINSMLNTYKEQGILPVWHLMGCETYCMVGNPGICVVADAVAKGFPIDKKLAFEAMLQSSLNPGRGQDLRMAHGYIPCDLYLESVANDMEYAIADGAFANACDYLAKNGMPEAAKYAEQFRERSHSYRNFFDSSDCFIKGLDSKGHFRKNFNPFKSEHRADDYCEGNGWQYTWLAPHDFKGLMNCFGSRDRMIEKLDSLFIVESDVDFAAGSPDISGLIGQYAHGNEPSHHIIYFYTMAGQPWKAADRLRETYKTMYLAAPDGLSGNEDVGQMSAWYILSTMGFYEVSPASGEYWFGSPLFDKVRINLPGGKTFTITAENNSDENRYIQSVQLNGKDYIQGYIKWEDIMNGGELVFKMGSEHKTWYCPDEPSEYKDQRPAVADRLFTSEAVENKIEEVVSLLENPRLAWMFANCFPNTLDTTVHFGKDENGNPDTFVYTGDIPAMWLRDSGAQVWPYLRFAFEDKNVREMIAGVINRQFKCICIDPYANAFNVEPIGMANKTDEFKSSPYVFERKWEIDSHCYPIRLAYEYWKTTGDISVFQETWIEGIEKILATLKEQQKKDGYGNYRFLRVTDRQLDTKCVVGRGNPVKPCGLIVSAFRPSDDATTFEYLIPSNFFAVSSLNKAAEILSTVNHREDLAQECSALAEEVSDALEEYAIVNHPEFGDIYAYEVDGYGNHFMMDDANVPSLLAMAYLGDVSVHDPIYRNTRRFVWSDANPYFFHGAAGEGIGGPHIGEEVIWPMSIMMRAFTSSDDDEIRDCIKMLMTTDAGTGFIHESFDRNDASKFTRPWFAWQNTLFGELILKLIDDGKLDVLNLIA